MADLASTALPAPNRSSVHLCAPPPAPPRPCNGRRLAEIADRREQAIRATDPLIQWTHLWHLVELDIAALGETAHALRLLLVDSYRDHARECPGWGGGPCLCGADRWNERVTRALGDDP